ncbi:uncharacterized protein LOC105843292 isoform X1 [Hydra vulgaris]|uniref:uncharacterized protein LOC105843292 isoform X1 n=1 Tax=Hydra vulgaris TaxID=6087 RepID=UPI0032EA7544
MSDVENSFIRPKGYTSSSSTPLSATPYKKRLRTLPNLDDSDEICGMKAMKYSGSKTKSSCSADKDCSESDDSGHSDYSKKSQIMLRSLPIMPKNQHTMSTLRVNEKEIISSCTNQVSSAVVQPGSEDRSLELTNFELSELAYQDDLDVNDTCVNDSDSLQIQLKKIHVIALQSYQNIKELTTRVCRMEDDLVKIKVLLGGSIPGGNQEQLFVMEQYQKSEDFQNFCKNLEDDSVFRKVVIKFMITNYGQKSISGCARSILKATLSDNLMTSFNRTGSRGQQKLPSIFERCIYSTIKSFYQTEHITIVRGKEEVETTIKKETEKQIEVYLSNSNCRIKAKLKDQLVLNGSGTNDHILSGYIS